MTSAQMAAAALGINLFVSCSVIGSRPLNVHELLLFGDAPRRIVWTHNQTPPMRKADINMRDNTVSFHELAYGNNAALAEPAVQVATTQVALKSLYAQAYGRQTNINILSTPSLMQGSTAIGIFLGQRPTGGYSVRAVSAQANKDVLTLTVKVQSPGPGSITTQALTSPWTIIRVGGVYHKVRVVDQQGTELISNTKAKGVI